MGVSARFGLNREYGDFSHWLLRGLHELLGGDGGGGGGDGCLHV